MRTINLCVSVVILSCCSVSSAQEIPEPEFKQLVLAPKIMVFSNSPTLTLTGLQLRESRIFCKYFDDIELDETVDKEDWVYWNITYPEKKRDIENCAEVSQLPNSGGSVSSSIIQTFLDFCHRLKNSGAYSLCK